MPTPNPIASNTRQQWEKHPNFPAQALLLGSHEGFRRVSQELVGWAHLGRSVSELSRQFHHWMAAMRAHESYEEGKLYPFLTRRFGVSTDAAQEGHGQLHEYERNVRRALMETPADAATGSDERTELVRVLRRFDEILHGHLALEEQLVIPLLLSLSSQEFRDYSYGRHSSLPTHSPP